MQDLGRQCLRLTREMQLAAETVGSSKWAGRRAPLYVPVTRIWPLALGPLPAERAIAGQLDSSPPGPTQAC